MSNTSVANSSLSSADLLEPSQQHNICIECNTSESELFPPRSRTSSIADDVTTLCPTIPTHIEYKDLDDITVASSPSIFLDRYLPGCFSPLNEPRTFDSNYRQRLLDNFQRDQLLLQQQQQELRDANAITQPTDNLTTNKSTLAVNPPQENDSILIDTTFDGSIRPHLLQSIMNSNHNTDENTSKPPNQDSGSNDNPNQDSGSNAAVDPTATLMANMMQQLQQTMTDTMTLQFSSFKKEIDAQRTEDLKLLNELKTKIDSPPTKINSPPRPNHVEVQVTSPGNSDSSRNNVSTLGSSIDGSLKTPPQTSDQRFGGQMFPLGTNSSPTGRGRGSQSGRSSNQFGYAGRILGRGSPPSGRGSLSGRGSPLGRGTSPITARTAYGLDSNPRRPAGSTNTGFGQFAFAAPIDFKPDQTFFPTGNLYEESLTQDVVWVRTSAYCNKIRKLRSDTDNLTVSYADVGKRFIRAARRIDENHPIVLAEAFELGVRAFGDNEKSNDRCFGLFAIRLEFDDGQTNKQKTTILRDLAQRVIASKATEFIDSPDIQDYTKAFWYDINIVNNAHHIMCALVQGLKGSVYHKFDHYGPRHVLEDLLDHVPTDDGGNLPKPLNHEAKRRELLGASRYTNSKVDGNAVSISYACTKDGLKAAEIFLSAFRDKETPVEILGGLPVTVQCFPISTGNKRRNNESNHISNVTTFATTLIKETEAYFKDRFKLITLNDVTSAVFDRRILNELTVSYEYIVALIPSLGEGNSSVLYNRLDPSLHYRLTIVLKRNSTTASLSGSTFKSQFRVLQPSLFNIEPQEPNDGYKLHITSRKPSDPPTKTSIQQDLHSCMSNIDKNITNELAEEGTFYLTLNGKGGRRSVSVRPASEYYGPLGVRFMTQQVSCAWMKSYTNENDAWNELARHYPGVINQERLDEFHSCVPITEHNLSPTQSSIMGKKMPRANAIRYTFTQADTDHMLDLRVQATRLVTGSEDGEIDRTGFYASQYDPVAYQRVLNDHGNGINPQAPRAPDPLAIREEVTLETPLDGIPIPSRLFPTVPNDNGNSNSTSAQAEASTAAPDSTAPATATTAPHTSLQLAAQNNRNVSNNTADMDIETNEEDAPTLSMSQELAIYQGNHDNSDNTSLTSSKQSPKKRKTGSSSTSLVAADNSDLPDFKWVYFAIPKSAVLYDVLSFASGFNPGFGQSYPDQAFLARHTSFDSCMVAVIECGLDDVDDFMAYVSNTPFFGKYQCQVASTFDQIGFTHMPLNDHLESLATHLLVRHVKQAIHPKFEDDLQLLLLDPIDGNQVFNHYNMNWSSAGDFSTTPLPKLILLPEPISVDSDGSRDGDTDFQTVGKKTPSF